MNEYHYTLDPTSRKFPCPACGKKRFVRYVDTSTGEYLPAEYGRCDREDNCGYHCKPTRNKKTDSLKPDSLSSDRPGTQVRKVPNPVFIPEKLFRESLKAYRHNNFVIWLSTMLDNQTIGSLIQKYHIGTSRRWPGSTIFYQIDRENRIHRGKIMLYNPDTGHRVKDDDWVYISSVHAAMELKDNKPGECLFGLHLLRDTDKPVAVVESEKTAILCSAFFPDKTWLATGSKGNFKYEMLRDISDRDVTAYPDLGCYAKSEKYEGWLRIAEAFPNVEVSDFLERVGPAHNLKPGSDLADLLTNSVYPLDWDLISLDSNDPEFIEAERYALNDAES